MKYFRFLALMIIAALAFSSLSVMPASAAGPAGSWVSGITCQNPDTLNSVSITISFFQQGNSTSVLDYPDTIAAGGTVKYFTPNLGGLPGGFQGSALVSAGAPVNCSVNTQSTGTGTMAAPFRVGTSGGFNDGAVGSTMYVPQITKTSTYNTYLAIQNTNSSQVDVAIHYFDRNTGAEVVAAQQTYTIQGNTDQVVYVADNTNLSSNFYGSAKIVATNPADTRLAVTVAFYNTGADYSTSQFLSYNGVNSGSNILYVPRVVRKYYGYNSGLTIQNIGPVNTTVTIDFLFKNGSTYSYTSPTILQGASLILYTPNISQLNPVDSLNMVNRTGSAKVTANAAGAIITGNVNMDNRGQAADNDGAPVPLENVGKGASYNLSPSGTETNTLVFTQVPKHAYSYTGGIVISNTQGAGTCDITFAGQPAATINDMPLPANGQISLFLGNTTLVPNLPNGFNASVMATCTTKVFGTFNFSIDAGSNLYGDSYIEDNALNQ